MSPDTKPSDPSPTAPRRGKWWLFYRTSGGDIPADSMDAGLLCTIELEAESLPPGYVKELYEVSPPGNWTLFDCIDDALAQEIELTAQLLKDDHASKFDFRYVSDEQARSNNLEYLRLRRDWKDIQEPREGDLGFPNVPLWVPMLSNEARRILDLIQQPDGDKQVSVAVDDLAATPQDTAPNLQAKPAPFGDEKPKPAADPIRDGEPPGCEASEW